MAIDVVGMSARRRAAGHLDAAVRRAVVAAVVLTAPSPALGHGPPAAVLGAASPGGKSGTPRFVRLTEGFAVKRNDSWDYICASRFRTESDPPATSADGEHLYVSGGDDLYILDGAGHTVALNRAGFSQQFVTGLFAVGDQAMAFRRIAHGTDLSRVDDGSAGPFWSGDGLYSAISADEDGVWLARVNDGRAQVVLVDRDGTLSESHLIDVEDGSSVGGVARSTAGIYLSVIGPFGNGELLRIAGADAGVAAVVRTDGSLSGPISIEGGAPWVEADGKLFQAGLAVESTDGGAIASYIGVGASSFLKYATTGDRLFRLEANGIGEELFDLRDLRPPDLTNEVDACVVDWTIFQSDLARAGVTLDYVDAGTSRATGDGLAMHEQLVTESGCDVSGAVGLGGPRFGLLGALQSWLMLACVRRLRRSRAGARRRRAFRYRRAGRSVTTSRAGTAYSARLRRTVL